MPLDKLVSSVDSIARENQEMNQYSPQEPREGYQPRNPYDTYNPYTSSYNNEQAQPTYVAQPAPAQHSSVVPASQGQGKGRATTQIWNALVRFLGGRGLLVAGGAILAILTFYLLPYYSIYSAHFLAADALDDKWWLELILPLLALVGVIVVQRVPRLKQNKRTGPLVIAGIGLLGILINYWFINEAIGSNYWRLGTWSYFLAMALVTIGGILLAM